MSQDGPWTIGRLLQWTTDHFRSHGAANPRLDAEILLAEARGCQRIELYTSYEEVPGEPILTPFRALVRRRAAGEPVAYLVGYREFYSLPFEVTRDVLIPRPETEFLVLALIDAAQRSPASDAPLQIVDVGTGSGAIAVCAAKNIDNCHVTAIDSSTACLAVARRNAERHHVAERIELVESDLLTDLPADRRFDFVVSNPPYVSEAEFADLPVDVRDFEPRLALVAGPTGTEVIERLIDQAADRLEHGGRLIFEISPMIEARTRELLESSGQFERIEVTHDLAALARVVLASRR